MIKKISSLVLLLSIMSFGLTAQTVPSPSEVSLNYELLNPEVIPDDVLDTLIDPSVLLTSNDTLRFSVSMLLEDTTVLNKVHIKLGSTLGANDLLNQTFIYDDLNLNLPQSYYREENLLLITLGDFLNTGIFYCEITLEDTQGNLSEIINCQSDQ